jgi:hypothetical protein
MTVFDQLKLITSKITAKPIIRKSFVKFNLLERKFRTLEIYIILISYHIASESLKLIKEFNLFDGKDKSELTHGSNQKV